MKKTIQITSLMLFALIFCLIFLFSSQISDALTTKLLIMNDNAYLGVFSDDTKVKHTFNVYNISFKGKNVEYISADCMSSKIKKYKKVIKPFKKHKINLEANTIGMNGSQTRIVMLQLRDLKEPVVLRVNYDIK